MKESQQELNYARIAEATGFIRENRQDVTVSFSMGFQGMGQRTEILPEVRISGNWYRQMRVQRVWNG